MGIYLRHSHLIKPERAMCGSDADVQASIFKNAERIGIDPTSILLAMPMWDRFDYSGYNLTVTESGGPSRLQNSIYFDGVDDSFSLPGGSHWMGGGTTVDLPISIAFGFKSIGSDPIVTLNGANPVANIIYDVIDCSVSSTYGVIWGFWGGIVGGSAGNRIRTGTIDDNIFSVGGSVVCTYSGSMAESGLKTYYWGKQRSTTSLSGGGTYAKCTPYLPLIGEAFRNDIGYHDYTNQYLTYVLVFRGELSASQSIFLSDNPYFLLQRVAPVYYSVPLSLNLTQYAFRFRNDNGDETNTGTGATYAANENTNITLTPGSKTRIRIGIDATGDPTSKQFQLEYRHKPSGGSFGTWGAVT